MRERKNQLSRIELKSFEGEFLYELINSYELSPKLSEQILISAKTSFLRTKELREGQFVAGIILILLGLSISGLRIFMGFHENSFMLLLGGLFIAAYFYKDSYGLLIPGCIIVGLGLSSFKFGIFRYSSHFNTIGLGLGFIGIYVIDRINKGKTLWWPLIPGGILTLVGLSSSPFNLWKFFHIGWPVILIALGLWIIAKSTGIVKGKEGKEEEINND